MLVVNMFISCMVIVLGICVLLVVVKSEEKMVLVCIFMWCFSMVGWVLVVSLLLWCVIIRFLGVLLLLLRVVESLMSLLLLLVWVMMCLLVCNCIIVCVRVLDLMKVVVLLLFMLRWLSRVVRVLLLWIFFLLM